MKKINMKGLRVRLMVIFSVTFLLLLVLLLSVTSLFFEDYYVKNNEKNIRHTVHEHLATMTGPPSTEGLKLLQRQTGGPAVVYGPDLRLIQYGGAEILGPLEGTRPSPPSRPEGESRPEVIPNAGLTEDRLRDLYEKAAALDNDGYFEAGEEMMYFALVLKEGEMLLVSKQMGLLGEAERMFDAFIARVAAVVYVFGILVVYFITKHLTRPILEMEQMTAKVAALDFTEKLIPKGSHETKHLMTSINAMTDNLSGTIEVLNATNEQLERELSKERSLEKMRRQFVSDVSHELKNPLAMIMGYADGLVQGIAKTDEARQDYYSIIMDESERMNRLVKDLLDLSGYESGTFTIEKETFDVGPLIMDAIERFSYITDEKTVHVDYDESCPFSLHADRLRVSQIIVNILSNAFKHVNDGGTIRIQLERTADKLRITVSNTGRLIPESALEDIWNSFYQVDTESRGNGLGLAIVKSIVKLHEGSCRAYVEDGFNCFEVLL